MILHNDAGGPAAAARAVKASFDHELTGVRTALDDLAANFATSGEQGPLAYVAQMTIDHPEIEPQILAADAVLGLEEFLRTLSVP